jgi:hypothetical protein
MLGFGYGTSRYERNAMYVGGGAVVLLLIVIVIVLLLRR